MVKQARAHIEVDRVGTDARAALRHEAALLARLEGLGLAPHPVELVEQDDSLFLVQERIAGQPLGSWVAARLRRDGSPDVDWAEAGPMARLLLDLLERVHELGLVLRDLSPGNVLVQPDGSLRLVDLELAAEAGRRAGSAGTPGTGPPSRAGPAGPGRPGPGRHGCRSGFARPGDGRPVPGGAGGRPLRARRTVLPARHRPRPAAARGPAARPPGRRPAGPLARPRRPLRRHRAAAGADGAGAAGGGAGAAMEPEPGPGRPGGGGAGRRPRGGGRYRRRGGRDRDTGCRGRDAGRCGRRTGDRR
ncbi:hypothetical protein ACFQ0M_16420 [Kitasatospora aburaviensis]